MVPLDQLPSLSTKGLLNSTVYDTPSVDSTSVNATVNATTIHANCGLLSNLTLGSGFVTTVIPTLGLVNMTGVPGPIILYWVTTALNFDNSPDEIVSVNTNWTYAPPGGNKTWSNTTSHIVACSLNATTTLDVLDVQNDILASTSLPQLTDSQSWQIWSPGGMTGLGAEISAALVNDVASQDPDYLEGLGNPFTPMDVYTMSLFGINATVNIAASATQSSADPSVTLSPSQFEEAISQIAAQYIWAAGHTNGNFGPAYGVGESIATDLIALRRLNVNTIPGQAKVVIASVASVLLFILAFYMIGVGSWTPSAITELGVLEALWLEAHSEVLHERMLQVEDPTVYNLRVAGMFDVCLADDVREVLDRDLWHDAGRD
ncbi:hypothetical protein OG21DRAFT_1607730 [Imleria badia]|nr:hypothetical protein OG21DRAFT_1607730 [Imleria badia]